MTSLGLNVGDKVAVEWCHTVGITGVKDDRGVVERIGPRFTEIRHPAGYTFTVADYDITTGTEIIVKERAKVAEAIDYIVPEGTDWRDSWEPCGHIYAEPWRLYSIRAADGGGEGC